MNGTALKGIVVNKLIDPIVDSGNLLFIDRDPLENESIFNDKSTPDMELALSELTRKNTQYLFNEIWKLPRHNVNQAICAELPEGTCVLPREKPIPQKRQPTKWEEFARCKGIVKKNRRDRKVFDENANEWKPRYGYRRASTNKDWLIEIPRQKDPYKDYFEERQQNKKNITDKYEYQRLKNMARLRTGANSTPVGAKRRITPFTDPLVKKENKRTSQELTNKMYRAKTSTASVGKFQDSIKGERKPKLGEKRKFESNEGNTANERQHQLELFSKIQAKKPKLNQAKFNSIHQQQKKQDLDNEDGDSKMRRKAGKNAPKRRSSGGAFNTSKSDSKRRQFFNGAIKKNKGGGRDGGRPTKEGGKFNSKRGKNSK